MNNITATEQNIIHLAQNPAKLLQAWRQLETQHQGPLPLRSRAAAEKLGVTEAQLIASRCGEDVTRIKGDWRELIEQLPQLGKIMTLTRNESAIHVCKGEYGHIDFVSHGGGGKIGVVENDLIELRIFLYRWAVGFAVVDEITEREAQAMRDKSNEANQALVAATLKGTKRLSLQFFDKYGNAIQKVSLLPEGGNVDAFNALVEKYKDTDQSTAQTVEEMPLAIPTQPDMEIDLAGLRQAWSELKDTHDFYAMIKKFGAGRLQALRLAGQQWAMPVNAHSVQSMLETASKKTIPIMVFIGNGNILQIYTGPVNRVKKLHGWLTVLDGDFNCYLWEEAIATGTAWIVRKPTVDGIVTALEVYDKNEELIVTFFGKRKPGIPEDLHWRELAESLVKA